MLDIQDLEVSFGGFRAVDGCRFTAPRGAITGLIGPNGAGKTTLFNLVAGALRPTSGRVVFEGRDVTGLSADALFRAGLVRTFQIPHEFHRLTARENLMMVGPAQTGEGLFSNWLRWSAVRREEAALARKADEVLEFLGLSHVADTRAGDLSGGQKKLLELGRTMMTDARMVLLDEPAAGVNRTLLREIEAKIAALRDERGYSFILIEHDMETIAKLCDPVVCMAEGRVLTQGRFADVRSDTRVLEAYLGERAA